MSRVILLCVLAAVALAAPGQTPQSQPARPPARKKAAPKAAAPKTAPAPDHWPLAAIQVTGNKIFPTEAIVKVTGLKLGSLVNASDFQRALQRLTDTGAFETGGFHYDPVGNKLSITFELQEVVDVYPVAFDRLSVPQAEVMQALADRVPLFGPQVPATGQMVKHILEALKEYLASKNEDVDVVSGLAPGPGGKLAMTFRPTAPPPKIVYVKFENSKTINPEDLQKGFFGASVGTHYTETRLQDLLDANIKPLFQEKGRLLVRFGPFRSEESKEPDGVIVTVPVQEGDEFHFDHIEFEGNKHVSSTELQHLCKLAADGLANLTLVKKAAGEIERRYQRDGYIKAKAVPEPSYNMTKKTLDEIFRITEGDAYAMRELTIKGLDINTEAEIRKMWVIKRGQPFDGAYPETFLKRLEEDKVFDNLAGTAHHENVDDPAKMVDVELEFRGGAAPGEGPGQVPGQNPRRRRP